MVNLPPQALKQLTLIFFMQKFSQNVVLRQQPNFTTAESTRSYFALCIPYDGHYLQVTKAR